jgi:hypothetical protein
MGHASRSAFKDFTALNRVNSIGSARATVEMADAITVD